VNGQNPRGQQARSGREILAGFLFLGASGASGELASYLATTVWRAALGTSELSWVGWAGWFAGFLSVLVLVPHQIRRWRARRAQVKTVASTPGSHA
jgi:hypothetical protein